MFDEKAALATIRAAVAEIEQRIAEVRDFPREQAAQRWSIRHQNLSRCRDVARIAGDDIAAQLRELAKPLTNDY